MPLAGAVIGHACRRFSLALDLADLGFGHAEETQALLRGVGELSGAGCGLP
jgi:hypothetical protein